MTPHPITGCLLGTAVGDAIGLPYEGLTRQRAARLLGAPDRHRLLFGRGMVSDDTEHTCMVAQALIVSGGDPEVLELTKDRNWLAKMTNAVSQHWRTKSQHQAARPRVESGQPMEFSLPA